MKRFLFAVASLLAVALAGCTNAATVADKNLSQAADNFEINRRITFVNGITDKYVYIIEGLCSLGIAQDGSRTVICKTGANEYKKHFLRVSDNMTYFAEQLAPAPANTYRYRVFFNPLAVIPDIDLR